MLTERKTKKYREMVQPHLEEIKRWYREEMVTDKEVYTRLGIGRSTFYDYKENIEEFSDTIMEGKQDKFWLAEKRLADIMDWHVTTKKKRTTMPDGSVKIEEEEVLNPPNQQALKLFLTTQMPEKYGNKVSMDHTHTGSIDHNIKGLENLSLEELQAIAAMGGDSDDEEEGSDE